MASMPITLIPWSSIHSVDSPVMPTWSVRYFSLSCSVPAPVWISTMSSGLSVYSIFVNALFTSSTEIPAPSGRCRKSRTTPSP